MALPSFVPHEAYREYPPEEMKRRAEDFYEEVRRRRTVRDFSDRPIPREVVEHALLSAGTAPNGANLQPWHFAVVSDPGLKRRIRASHPDDLLDLPSRNAYEVVGRPRPSRRRTVSE